MFPPRGFVGSRVFVGPRFYAYPYYGPYYAPYYAYPYYPYYDPEPPVVVTPPPVAPLSYVEQAPPASQYWHYCQNPAGYYPQVPQCPGGWIQVAPRSE